MRIRVATTAWLLMTLATIGAAYGADIPGNYSGRYRCRDWNTLDLRIEDHGGGRLSAVFTFAVPAGASGSYSMTGQYDERAGRFQLVPQRWIGRPPQGFQMVGMTGRFDPSTRRLTGKIDTVFCFQFELAGEGGAPLAPLPAASAPAVGNRDYATDPVQNTGTLRWPRQPARRARASRSTTSSTGCGRKNSRASEPSASDGTRAGRKAPPAKRSTRGRASSSSVTASAAACVTRRGRRRRCTTSTAGSRSR